MTLSTVQRRHRFRLPPLLLLVLIGTTGCYFKGDGVGRVERAAEPADGTWRVEPLTLRVHPTTRIDADHRPALLNVRIEMFDAMGDPVKGAGRFDFTLLDAGRSDHRTTPQRVAIWRANVLDLDAQRRYHESVSRTYLFPLALRVPVARVRDAIIEVTFTAPGRPRLHTRAALGAGLRDAGLPVTPMPALPREPIPPISIPGPAASD